MSEELKEELEITEENDNDKLKDSSDEKGNDSEEIGLQKKDKEEDVIPDTYDYKSVPLPEGMELDKDLTDEFSSIAKEVGLTQKNADKFMGLGIKLSGKLQEKFQYAMKELQENQIKSYETMLNTDPEIGGANLKATLLEANEAYKTFVSDEAAQILSETGLNKHPAIVKVFRDIGRQIKNDTITNAGKAQQQRSAADWYPNMTK